MATWRIPFIILALAASAILLCNFVDAHCRRHDRKCCRKKIRYGSCHNYARRWAYNISCGRCVPFEYSGCDGDDNNFLSFDECSDCCLGTSPCPQYSLPKPPYGCQYKWYDGPDYCQRPKLDCNCRKSYCRPDSCRFGQRCIPTPYTEPCRQCPCPQYQCISDPCYGLSDSLRPCEKCLSLPAPSCHRKPCPLIAYRESRCQPYYGPPQLPPVPYYAPAQFPPQFPPVPYFGAPQLPPLSYYAPERLLPVPYSTPRHCPLVVECPPQGEACYNKACPAYPTARCIRDPCDCRKNWWYSPKGLTLSNEQCFYYGNR